MVNTHSGRQQDDDYAIVSQVDQPWLQHEYTGYLDSPQVSTRGNPMQSSSMDSHNEAQYMDQQQPKEPVITMDEDLTPSSTTEWRSWKLSWWFNTLALIAEVGFIVTILVLDHMSAFRNGIATVDSSGTMPTRSFSMYIKLQQYQGLLWTALPSLSFTLLSLTWAAIVAASYERQPYIELHRGGMASRTIMLDYTVYPGLYNWAVAFSNNHIHIGCGMLLALILSIVVVPLSARLFVASMSAQQFNVSVAQTAQYNNSENVAFVNLQPFIDLSSAIHVYGSSPPAWMTTEYAFNPLSITSGASLDDMRSANLSATTDAYSAYLDCRALDSSSFTATLGDQGSSGGNLLGSVVIKIVDRECSITQVLALSNNTATYSRVWWDTCKGQTTSRFGMLAATYSATSANKLTDLSLISCIPSYWHSTGLLTVSLNSASPFTSNFVSYQEHNSSVMNPSFAVPFEFALPNYVTANAGAAVNANSLGFAILSASKTAANKNSTAAMQPGSIKDATEKIFSTMYAAFVTTDLLVPLPTSSLPASETAMISQPVNRLYVTHPIAYTITTILILVLVNHIVLWIYAARHKSVLKEEPIGLLGHAVLLNRSDVDAVVAKVRAKSGNDTQVRDGLKKHFHIKRTTSFWDERTRRIAVGVLAEK